MSDFNAEMAPLFKEAREKDLMFFVYYQQLWFTPDELETEQKVNGRFRWSAVNWKLRPKEEFLQQRRADVATAQAALDRAIARIGGA